MIRLKQKIQKSGRLQKQHSHNDRSHITDHKGVKLLAAEGMAAYFHFFDDPFWLNNPSDKDARQERNGRHQEAVADVIHQIQKLCRLSVRKLQFKIEHIVAEADEGGSSQGQNADEQAHFFACLVEQFHTVGNECFHNGNAGGQCCKRRSVLQR